MPLFILYFMLSKNDQADEAIQMLVAFLLSHSPELAWARQKNHPETPYKDNAVQSRVLQNFLLQDLTFNGQL